ncbi:MAG TPA: iron chelate uptake ABC transporter family permease subunit, partial [bacterium]|nr:iron chelate uptake ABC transporter family permease subunit [bacterium]
MRAFSFKLIILSFLILCGFLLFSFLGDPVISLRALFDSAATMDRFVLLQLRLPKLVLAFVIGAALSVSGVSFQSLLKNPLADPYILGISGGAALGYVLAVVLGLPFIIVPVAGFIFALLTLLLIYRLACTSGVLSVVNLLLIGIVFNAFSFALILLVNSLANFGQAQQIL